MSGIGHNGGPPVEEEDNPFGKAGWIKIGRDVRNHHLVGFGKTVKPADPDAGHCHSRGEAWLDLLMECRYSAGTVVNKGTKMEIKPGQLLGAVSWLASRWNWTPKTVRWFLDQLQDDGMIERIAPPSVSEIKQTSDVSLNDVNNGNQGGNRNGKYNGNQSSVLSISKFEIYQFVSQIQRQPKRQPTWQPEGQPSGNPTATERQPNGNTLRREEGKKGRREEDSEGTINQSETHDSAREASVDQRTVKASHILAEILGSTDEALATAERWTTTWAEAFGPAAVFDAVLDYQARRNDRTELRFINERLFGEYVRQAERNLLKPQASLVPVEKPPPKAIPEGPISTEMSIVAGGGIDLVNGKRAHWLREFDNDAKLLDLALIEIAGRLSPHGTISLERQIESGLARICRDARTSDKRYQTAAKSRGQTKIAHHPDTPNETSAERLVRLRMRSKGQEDTA